MQPKTYFAKDHGIDPALIDRDALYVLERLRHAGFTAYLVGGSVRDLLLKRVPKDFDISTSARPEQIKAIFQRQCILIGRRFRLAHIRFGHKIIEVSTFRTGENDSGLILHDNEWGTPEEDVLRRDFTINGLFYDSSNHSIIDYVNGWEDVQKHLLRTIGEPEKRFKQDPVRLLRLLKFHARYNFKIEEQTEQAIHVCRIEITKSSPARILEEILRMLESGASAPFIKLLAEYGILNILFPSLTQLLKTTYGKTIFHYLTCADQLYQHKGKNVLDRAILTACLLFPVLERELDKHYLSKKQTPHIGEITLVASSLVKEILIQSFSHFPRRITSTMLSILVAQYRLTPLSGKRHYREKLFRQKDFELALKFFKLRALVNEKLVETYSSIRDQYRQFVRHGERRHHNYHGRPAHSPHQVISHDRAAT
ncbi:MULTISPECIES: polynucleotide adenylyltransferase PcnB [Candidatus Protochlamydia]|uniref:Poly(A) polymerase I n=1 Tax=Candidatus Protochlamydia amoebophila TaxID=362787 RepID=A0A0C1H0F9_9BACT|nr:MULTISPECIES: polynucleotide adenylyltransferase PcnB [Protochlamydia]KIC71249.1 putative poly(A) polymerase [Candidatus Protochlamydia amoebophila]